MPIYIRTNIYLFIYFHPFIFPFPHSIISDARQKSKKGGKRIWKEKKIIRPLPLLFRARSEERACEIDRQTDRSMIDGRTDGRRGDHDVCSLARKKEREGGGGGVGRDDAFVRGLANTLPFLKSYKWETYYEARKMAVPLDLVFIFYSRSFYIP